MLWIASRPVWEGTLWQKPWVTCFLVGVASWPILQIGLASRYGMSPWKLGAWGMYTVPDVRSATRIFAPRLGLLALKDMTPRVREAVIAYHQRWRILGRLASPRQALLFILDDFPKLNHLKLVSERLRLDPRSSRIVRGRDIYLASRIGSKKKIWCVQSTASW